MKAIYRSIAFTILYLLILSACSSIKRKDNILKQNIKLPQYEYIIKDDFFRNEMRDSLSGKFIKLTNGYTYYELANSKKNNPTIVLVHGFSIPSYIWDTTFYKAKELGFKVLRFDLYGRGYSDNPEIDYTDELFAKQSLELLDSLQINKLSLVGLSNGGRVISKIAQLNSSKIENLVYVSSNGFMDIDEKSNKFVSEDEISEFIKDYKNLSKSQMSDFKNPKLFEGWDIRYSKLQKFKGFAKALISTLKNHVSLDTIHLEIASKNIKVYTIWGEYDSVVNFDDFKVRLNRIMPNRKEFFIESAGHLPQMESPSEFNSILFDKILDFTQ